MVKTIKKHLQKNKTPKTSKKKSQKGGEDENGVKEIVTLDNVKNKLNLSLTKLQELNNNQNNVTLKDINEKNLLVSFNETFITYLKNNFNKNTNSINGQSLFSDEKLNELNYSRLLNGKLGNTDWPTDEQKQDMILALKPKITSNQNLELTVKPLKVNASMSNSEITKIKKSTKKSYIKLTKELNIENLIEQKNILINMLIGNVIINYNNNKLNNKTYYNKYLINPLEEALSTANNLLTLYNKTNNNNTEIKKKIKNAKQNIVILKNIIKSNNIKINNLENESKITIGKIIRIINNVLIIINNNNKNSNNNNNNNNNNNIFQMGENN